MLLVVDLQHHTQGLAFLKSNYRSWLEALDSYLVSRLKVQEQLAILTQAVAILATHGWEHNSTPLFGHSSLQGVCDWFSNPLEKAGIWKTWRSSELEESEIDDDCDTEDHGS